MSYDILVYLKRSKMPSPKIWQKAIVSAGFPVLLDSDFDVDLFSGFLPCPVDGKLSGFEYYSSVLSSDDERDIGVPADADFSIQLCIGAQPLELVSALAAASVLAEISGGVLCDPQEGDFFASEEAVSTVTLSFARRFQYQVSFRTALRSIPLPFMVAPTR